METKFITAFLGIQDVQIEEIRLREAIGRADINVRFQSDNSRCPDCGWKLTRIHDWQWRKIQGPPMGVFTHVVLHVAFPRAYCVFCKRNRSPKIPWQHPHCSSVTCGFAEVAGRLMEETTCEAASRLLHGNARTFWELDQFRMELLSRRMKLPADINLSYLSADEVHFKTIWTAADEGPFANRWKPQFVTNLVSYHARKVLGNAAGRGAEALSEALCVLSNEQKLGVKNFGLDMHDPFISVVSKECPRAEICIDRFHLVQQVNRTFDEVRKSEFKKARESKIIFLEGMLSPSRRFILVERHRKRSAIEVKMLDRLRQLNDNIHLGMLLVESFHFILDKKNLADFRQGLVDWYKLVRESRLKPFKKLARTISKYRHYIEPYITSRLTTAVSEGLNNKIKTLKRMAYGYTNPKSFRNKILQRCGYLNHYYINTNDLFLRIPSNAP